jgi:2-polyprenyl-3-methyl-5-hydroxy-6-metoxy-1,4-benzoquinol methylase
MNCYLCHAETRLFLTKNNFELFVCPECGLIQTDLKKDYAAFVAEHYTKGYYTGDPRFSAYVSYKEDKPFIVRNMKKFLAKVRKVKPQGRLLDVGCAMGYFVELALRAGYDAHGFDPSAYAIEHAKKNLLNGRVRQGTIAMVSYPEKSFDVVSLFDVFEHLGDPKADLIRIREWLEDDGVLVVATGNTGSLAAKVFGRKWTFYIPPQHLFFFNRANLTRILGEAGFEPVAWSSVGKWLSLRYVLHLARTTGESLAARYLYDLVRLMRLGRMPLFVPMGDNMIVVARKKK